MRRITTLIIAATIGCSSKGSTTVGDCPDGLVQDTDGSCIEATDGDETAPGDSDGETDDIDENDDGDENEDSCTVELESSTPSNGEAGVYWRDAVVFTLDGPDETAVVSVVDGDGSAVDGAVENNEGRVTWTALGGLTPSSEHTATLVWCGGEEAVTFTTSDLGAPLETDIDGNVYVLDLSSATLVEPAGLGAFLDGALDIQLLVSVAVVGSELDFIGAATEDGSLEQDECAPTFGFERIDFSSEPFFEAGPIDLPVDILETSLTLWGMYLSGTFEADGGGMSAMGLEGALDIRELGPAFGDLTGGLIDLTDPDTACGTITLFGVSCQACPSGDGDYCIGVDLDDIEADLTDSTVVPIEPEDISDECE